ESVEDPLAGTGMATVQRAHPHREREVVASLARRELELLGVGLSSGEPTRRDEIARRPTQLRDRLGGSVDREHVTLGADPVRHLAGRGPGTAADLDHPHPGLEWQRVDYGAQSR